MRTSPGREARSGQLREETRFERTTTFFAERLIPALHGAGVRLLAGSDAPIVALVPGFALHDELDFLARSGLTRQEVLETATSNPAEWLGMKGRLGVVRENAAADLVLVRGNPLDDLAVLRQPLGVMTQGRWLPASELERSLEELAARYSR